MPQVTDELARRNAELNERVGVLSEALARSEAASQLALGVVHDLRNAFHVILVAGGALTKSLTDPAELELAEAVLEAGTHANTLASELLELSRRESSRTAVVEPQALLESVERLARRILGKKFESAFEIAEGLAPIVLEAHQLEAALINLIVNARDAMPDGGKLRVSARNLPPGSPLPGELAPGTYVEFSVEDTGIGMPPETVDRATEAFFTTKKDRGGTGLGLAMTHAFAVRNGGALRIDSEPGRGTRVRILLPGAAPAETANPDADWTAKLHKLRQRIRAPELQSALDAWQRLCRVRLPPRRLALERALATYAATSIVLEVDSSSEPPRLRLCRIGDALARALGGAVLEDVPLRGPVVLGSLGAAYRRVQQSGFPNYEYARYALGDETPDVFERLILPAADDDRQVSQLIGIVQLSRNMLGESSHDG